MIAARQLAGGFSLDLVKAELRGGADDVIYFAQTNVVRQEEGRLAARSWMSRL